MRGNTDAARQTVGNERGKDETRAKPATAPPAMQVYVQPTKALTNAEDAVGVDSTTAPWVRHIETWAKQYGTIVFPVWVPPVPPPLVRDVFIVVHNDGAFKHLEAQL
jgi:hypothetical protein